MSSKIPCVNKNCKAMILQSTADRTGGYCMPCYQDIKRKEREEFIKKNRKDVNLYEGVNDPVEILKIMHAEHKYDPLVNYIKYEKSVEEVYSLLSDEDIKQMKEYARELIENEDIDKAQQILLSLVCFTNTEIHECLRALIKNGECYPGTIFKNAPKDVRDYLICEIAKDQGTLGINHIICALSWIGDQKVVDLFSEWRNNPPKWADKLLASPENYSYEAGWELNSKGERENLFYDDCYAIEKEEPSQDEVAVFLEKSTEKCGWCGGNLINLFSFDLNNPFLKFINFKGSRLNIATCPVCTCYGFVYTDIDKDGFGHFSALNVMPDYIGDSNDEEDIILKQPIRMSREKRSCYHAANEFLDTTFSQVGGHPTWVQDAEYPKCPKCSKSMKFVGQIDMGDVEEYGEGTYYAFACEKCNMAATNYQQT